MNLLSILRDGVRTLQRNKLRSALTVLGIAIGIGAVICVVAIGDAGSAQIEQQMENLGDNYISVGAGSRSVGGVRTGGGGTKTLTVADANAIREQVPSVKLVAPKVNLSAQVVYGNLNWSTQLRGITPEFFDIRRWGLAEGAPFTQDDVDKSADVCVLGRTVRDQLFAANEDPIGKTVKVTTLPCKVIGVLTARGQGAGGDDQDDTVILPVTTVMKKLKGQDWVDGIWCSAVSFEAIPLAKSQITGLLHERHRIPAGQGDDFTINTPIEQMQTQLAASETFTLFLMSIGSVSLLVGGIGIMNVMLVSVTERTREIGVRMAVGATQGMVQMQFLGEAVILSLVGGAIGVLMGAVGSLSLGYLLQWHLRISLQAVLTAVAFSIIVGVFFGYYPARRASMLDPIEALRFQ